MSEKVSASTKRVEQIDQVLGQKKNGLDFWQLVYDPDYGKTIENIFHTSFLLKDGHAKLDKHDNTVIACTSCAVNFFVILISHFHIFLILCSTNVSSRGRGRKKWKSN